MSKIRTALQTIGHAVAQVAKARPASPDARPVAPSPEAAYATFRSDLNRMSRGGGNGPFIGGGF